MYRNLVILLGLFAAALHPARAAIPRWDALPAIDVLHLQGPYAGRVVCPMCQHGYDAGMLVILPSTTSPADAARAAAGLRTIAEDVTDARFRSFLVLAGPRPSADLLAALASREPRWHLAQLAGNDLASAAKDLDWPLQQRALGMVFAQRRLLLNFDPLAVDRTHMAERVEHARAAMRMLQSTYPQPAADNLPDTPKGRLWTAPHTLSSRLVWSGDATSVSSALCFHNRTIPAADALVALQTSGPTGSPRVRWAKTDADGCLMVSGIPSTGTLRSDLFPILQPSSTASTDVARLHRGRRVDLAIASLTATGASGREPVVGLPCEGCEGIFQNLPDRLAGTSRLTSADEPGEPLHVSGTVRDRSGTARAGVVVYAYQTDASGRYRSDPALTGAAALQGAIRGWAITDASGRYAFDTIRPGGYPGESIPQHIHLHLIEPRRCTYYVGDLLFDDDPRLTRALINREVSAYGGSGVLRLTGNAREGWFATRNITLGLNVPGYAACER